MAAGESITLAQGTAAQAGWKFNGNASVASGEFVLTPSARDQSGSIFNLQRVRLGSDYSFSAAFSFRISNNVNGGADGIVFALQTQSDSALTEGFGIGYAGLQNSLGIEFDTYYNNAGSWPTVADPDGNHIGIDYNGDIHSVQTASASPINLKDGSLKYAWIDYDGSTGNLEIRLANSDTRPASAQLSRTVDLPALLGQQFAYVGFTSATGGSWSKHAVSSLYFANSYHAGGLDLSGGTVYTQNQPPTASDQTIDLTTGVSTGRVTAVDPEGDPLQYRLVDGPSHGSVTLNPDGTFQYVPSDRFSGTDAFTYWAMDDDQVSNLATVTFHVAPSEPGGTGSAPVDTPASKVPGDPHQPNAGREKGGKFEPAPPKSFVAVMTQKQIAAKSKPPVSLTPDICQTMDTRIVTIKPGLCAFKLNGKTRKFQVQKSARKQAYTAKLRTLTVITFKSDSTALVAGQKRKLRKAKRVLNGAPAIAFARAFNAGMGNNDLLLSQQRGKAIAVALGSKRKIQVVALGSSAPVSTHAVPNRSVTVYY